MVYLKKVGYIISLKAFKILKRHQKWLNRNLVCLKCSPSFTLKIKLYADYAKLYAK